MTIPPSTQYTWLALDKTIECWRHAWPPLIRKKKHVPWSFNKFFLGSHVYPAFADIERQSEEFCSASDADAGMWSEVCSLVLQRKGAGQATKVSSVLFKADMLSRWQGWYALRCMTWNCKTSFKGRRRACCNRVQKYVHFDRMQRWGLPDQCRCKLSGMNLMRKLLLWWPNANEAAVD